jgi:hypothetical protein
VLILCNNVLLGARVIAFGLIGKAKAIPPVRGLSSVVDNLNDQVENQIQYLVQIALRSNKLLTRVASADAANQAAKALPTESRSLEILRNAIIKAKNAESQDDGCIELTAKYTAPEHANQQLLAVLRKTLLSQDLKVKVQAQLRLGESCQKLPYKLSMDGELVRDSDMTKYAQKESDEAQACEEDEKKGFSLSDSCLEVANTQAAALNKIRLTFKVCPVV